TPLSAQRALAEFARPRAPGQSPADCNVLREAVAAAERNSNGRLATGPDGTIRIDGALWRALPAVQRQTLEALAQQLAACAGDAAPQPIRDLASGEALSST